MIIFRRDGTEIHEIESFNIGSKLVKKLMGDDYVIIPFTSVTPIEFKLGDYIDVYVKDGNVRYELVSPYIPTYDVNTATYKYDLRLDAYYMKWANKIVKYDPQYGASELSFALTSSIGTHTSIILANLAALSYTYWATNTNFVVSIDESVDQTAAKLVQYDNISILDAITSIAKTFECEWWVTDNVIHFGKCQAPSNVNEVVFTLGDNISDMSKSSNGTDLITKLYAFGSDKNLPRNYKKNENAEVVRAAVVQRRLMLPTAAELSVENAQALAERGYTLNADGSITIEPTDVAERLVEGVIVNDDVYPKTECTVASVSTYESSVTEEDESVTTETYYRLVDGSGFAFTNDMILDGETLHIIFTSGSLNGMDFECEHSESGGYYEVVANENYGRKLPDVNLHPSVGDKFVLYNWDSSKLENTGLIPTASNKLLEEIIKYLDKAKIDPNDYTCTEECFANDYTIRELGDKVRLVNPAYFTNGRSSRIVGIEINLDLPYDHPKYICGEKADYVFQGKVSQTEELTFNGQSYQGKSSGGGSSIYLIRLNDMTPPSDSNAYSAKRVLNDFISSIDDDAALGLIQFLGGLTTGNFSHGYNGASIDEDGDSEFATALIRRLINSGDFIKGQLGGAGWGIYRDGNGFSTMEVDNLIVRMKAIFAELEIRKMSYIGGDYIFSAAGSRICKVEYLDSDGEVVAQTTLHALTDSDGNFIMDEDVLVVWNEDTPNTEDVVKFRCYLYADDGTTRTMNLWQVDDQARCQTFNIQSGVYQNVANRFYWRRVVGVGTKVLEDGRTYNYVDLSNVDHAGAQNAGVNSSEPHYGLVSDFPQPSDVIVQLGSRTVGNRQNAIEIVVEGNNAPAIIEYKGIDDYNLASHRMTVLSPNGDEFVAKSYSLVTANDVVRVPRERGQWTGDKITKVVDQQMVQEIVYYEYYDRVSWNGSLWLMTNNTVANINGYSDSGYDSSGNGIVGDRKYEPKDGSVYWTKQVSGGVSQSIVCSPNPVLIETSNERWAKNSSSQAVTVDCYVGGTLTGVSSFTLNAPSNRGWTAAGAVANNALTVTVSWTAYNTISNGVVNISAALVSGETVNGSFVVAANVNGNNGLNAPYLVIDHDTFFIDTDADGYPLTNVDTYVDFRVMLNGTEALTDDVYYEEYRVMQGNILMADVDVRDLQAFHVIWRSTYQVRDVDIPFTVEYLDASEFGYPAGSVQGMFSVRANKVGPAGRNGTNGESAMSVSVTPQVYFVPINESNRTLTEHYETIEVRCFLGSRQVNAYNIHNVVLDGPFFIDDTANEIERVGSDTVEFATISFGVDDNAFFNSPAYLTFSVESDYEEYQCKVTVMPLRKGDNGRGISNITVEYAITSGTDAPQANAWATDYPNVSTVNLERKYIWRRTTITYTDNSQPKVTVEVIYSGGDGENGTSFTIKGTAIKHVNTTNAAIANHQNGLYLVDEDSNANTAVVNVTNWQSNAATETAPSNGDAYIAEDTDHIWIATDGGWLDAGTIRGVDGLPSYIHFAWANSSDGSLDFTVVKAEGVDYSYMGVCADNTQVDPGYNYNGEYDNDPTNVNAPWHAYTWNKTGEGDKGTTILGDAIAHITDATLSSNNPNNANTPFKENGLYLLDLDEWSFSSGTWTHGNTGSGLGHKLMTKASSISFADPDEADTYLIDGYLWSSIDHVWLQVSQERYNGTSTYIHYAWANSDLSNSDSGEGFTVSKAVGVNYLYMGICTDENEYDPGSVQDPQMGTQGYKPWRLYDWNLIKGDRGDDGTGIDRTVIEYNVWSNGTTPPTDNYWADSIANALSARNLSTIPDRWYVWTRTTIYYTGGLGNSVSYSVAYQGHEGRDGTSVNIKGTFNSYAELEAWYADPNHDAPVYGDAWIIGGYLYMYDGEEWHNLGKFTGDDGRTSYFHVAWMNRLNNADGSFTTEKEEGVDYYYMGTCVDFNQVDPGTGWNNQTNQYDTGHSGPSSPWTSYDWNLVKGAEGTKGTAVKGHIIAHLLPNGTATEQGLYAVDEYKGTDVANAAKNRPALARYSSGWTIEATNFDESGGNNIDEGESYIDNNGHLWSYIENAWEDLGQYVGSSTYLHLAWANSPDGSSGFTTSKTAFVDYSYVGFCSDNNEEDPGSDYNNSNSPNYHQGTPWTQYTWKRLRGLSPAIIQTQTDQVVVDADNDGKIVNITQVTGLPSMVALTVDDDYVPSRNWSSAKITFVFSDNTELDYHIDDDSLRNVPSPNDGIYITHWNRYDGAGDGNNGGMARERLYWAYRQNANSQDPVINIRQLKFSISASYQGNNYTAYKTIPFLIQREGEKAGLIVQYSADPVNDQYSWHTLYDPLNDKWMRISIDGGSTWSDAMKIVADQMELNVKGKALYHVAAVSNAQQRVSNDQTLIGQGKWGLVDSYTQSGQTKYSGVIEFSSLSSYIIAEADIGDGYILNDASSPANGHLFLATADGWSDAGQISGEKGADAIFAMLNPPNAIAQQLTDAADSSLTPITTSVIVTRGSTPILFGSGGFSLAINGTQNCNAAINPTTGLITVTALTHQESVSNGMSSSIYYVPYDHGTVTIRVTYQSYQADLVFQWYANLLGTWKQTIQGDINRAVANKVSYRRNQTTKEIECIDDNGQFLFSATNVNFYVQELINGKYVGSSTYNQDYQSISQTVQNAVGDIAALKLTADSITSTVSSMKVMSSNMFSFTEGNFNANVVPYIQGYGIEGKGSLVRISKLGTNSIGGDFVVSCEMRMKTTEATINVNMCDVNPIKGLGSVPNESDTPANGAFTLGTTWTKKTFVFEIPNNNSYLSPTGQHTYNGFLDFEGNITDGNRIYVKNLQVERGRAATAFGISEKDANAYNSNDILTFNTHPSLTKESSKYKGYDIFKFASGNFGTGDKDLLYKSGVSLSTGKVYTLSFYAKGGNVILGCYLFNNNGCVNGTIAAGDVPTLATSLAAGGMTAFNQTDGATYIKLTAAYKRYTVHWFNQNSGNRDIILGRINSSWQSTAADVYITGIEFREGYWTDAQMESQSMIQQTADRITMTVENLGDDLSTQITQTASQIELNVKNGLNSTGINIEDGSITLNADKTTVIGDLSLEETNQGLVLYGGGNVAKVAVKADSIGSLNTTDFGSVFKGGGNTIGSHQGVATFETITLGTVSSGDLVECTLFTVNIGKPELSGSATYKYTVKCGSSTLVSNRTGQVSYVAYGFNLPSFSGTAGASGNLTVNLEISGSIVAEQSLRALIYIKKTGTGLNKIGADGAVFANSQTHYNWFGNDKTEMKNDRISVGLDSEWAWYSPCNTYEQRMELGSCTTVALVSHSASGVHSLGNNVYEWFANLKMGVIVVNESSSYTFHIYLPDCRTCRGKIFYIKKLLGSAIVFMNNSGNSSYFIPSDGDADNKTSSISIGKRASMFISCYDYWLEFDCS